LRLLKLVDLNPGGEKIVKMRALIDLASIAQGLAGYWRP